MGCLYCEKAEKLRSFAYPVCELTETTVYLHKEQSYPGRLILVLKRHAEEYCELTDAEREGVQKDLYRAAKAMETLFHPQKVNLGVFGDTVRHFHIHVVPKTEGGLDWNGMFQMNPNAIWPSDGEMEKLALAYREALGE